MGASNPMVEQVTKETRERTVTLLKKRVDDFVRAGITRGKRSLSDSVTRSLQTLVHEARHQALTEHFGKSGEISHFIYVAFAMHKFPETWPERKVALTHVAEVYVGGDHPKVGVDLRPLFAHHPPRFPFLFPSLSPSLSSSFPPLSSLLPLRR